MLEAQGFDPSVGYLHGIRYGRKSLALDVVEPFRQPVIDRLTLRILNHRQITEEDFEGGEKGLRLEARAFKRYLGIYEEHLRSLSAGDGSSDWRSVVRRQVSEIKEMVMNGKVQQIFSWAG